MVSGRFQPMNDLLFALTFFSALGCGLIAGVFFAFSAFVMKALGRIPAAHGMAAMQSINVVVLNPLFLGVFLGTAAGCFVLAIDALREWHKPGSVYALAGGLLYLVGTVLVTRAFNIPRNNALAKAGPTTSDGATLWADYLKTWTNWNHVRTAASLAAAASLIVAITK
jgi:uncharacterized membrane protein